MSYLQETVSVNISKCEFTLFGPTPSLSQENEAATNGAHINSDIKDSEDDVVDKVEEVVEEDTLAELDAFHKLGASSAGLDNLTAAVYNDANVLLQPSEQLSEFARTAAKELIDYAGRQISAHGAATAPPPLALYVTGFDPEQIWLQLDMISDTALKRARRLLRKAGDVSRLVSEDVEEALDGEQAFLFSDEYINIGQASTINKNLKFSTKNGMIASILIPVLFIPFFHFRSPCWHW